MFQGAIWVENNRYIIDADPHVMRRIRPLFDNGQTYHSQGKHTHKPLSIPVNLSSARDLVWICDRYPISMSSSVQDQIKKAADEYDQITLTLVDVDQDCSFKVSDQALELAISLRDHQIKARNMWLKVKRYLLADKVGMGKTASALSGFCEPEARPALVVVPTHLCTQWQRELNRFLPDAKVHVITGFKNYQLPDADVFVTSYNRLNPWQDTLIDKDRCFPTVVFDEAHELRHVNTGKRRVARALSLKASMTMGLTGTPIYNYGSEIWSVLDVIAPDALGEEEEFKYEWCHDQKVREPTVLHSYLKSRGLFLRRTPEDVGMNFGTASKHVYTLDADLEKLEEVENVAKMLAMSVLSGNVGESAESAREFDWKLRHATGVAKARPVAEFVKMICDQGDKVLLGGWHRDVYSIWMEELAAYNPVMFTGSESPAEKDKTVKKFIESDECKVMMISLRSGSGLDGLQRVCNNVVIGELDWSPHVMDQLVGRLDRDGQTKHVQAFYLTINDGADPFMTQVLNLKRSQHDGLVEGEEAEAKLLENQNYNASRIRDMAAAYLKSIGEEVPEPVKEEGLLGEVAGVLRRIRVPSNTEEEMQLALASILPGALPDCRVSREVRVGKRSRLDFLVMRGDENVAIECKINQTSRQEVYRQVRKYAKEASIKSLVLFAPWGGIPPFIVDGIPVVVVDFSALSL